MPKATSADSDAFLDACEVVKAKKERAAAHRRLEKAEVDLEDSERRIR